MYSPRWLYAIPGSILFAFGLVLGALLFWQPLHIASVALDLNGFIVACFLCVVGTQFMVTGAVVRQFATRAGFLPPTASSERVDSIMTTDGLTLFSVAVVLLGLAIFSMAALLWASVDFGNLSTPFAARLVLTGLTLVVIGLQLFASAFLSGILQIPEKTNTH